MTFKSQLFCLFYTLLLFFGCTPVSAEQDVSKNSRQKSLIAQKEPLKAIGAVQLKLSNGMTVCLKSTDTDTGEFYFKLAALGGYGSLGPKNIYSGRLADRIAWESGMGGMTSDQVSVFLHENSLEFVVEITAFSRTIVGNGLVENLDSFLKCVKMVFTEQQFTEEGFNAAKILAKDTISKMSRDNEHAYEEAFLRVNTQNFSALRPFTVEDLAKVKFDKAKKFFQQSFSDPSEFYCVITGNFDVETAAKLVEKHLAAIVKSDAGFNLNKSFNVPFPPGITKTVIKLPNQTSCLTHITFPLQIAINDSNISEISFMCQIIEARLRRVITEKMDLSYGVDVSYEFPVYPFLNNPWISIRYRCEDDLVSKLHDIVIAELKRLQTNGATLEEVLTIKKLEKGSQEFWLKDDFYLVSMLENYYLWGWNPEKIDYQNTPIYSITVESVNELLRKAISLANYSVVSAITN